MEDDHVNSDLLEDEELASLRLAALATLKHKKTNTTVSIFDYPYFENLHF